MAEVFVSYARSNEALATRVETALKALGHNAWRDDQLPAHRAYSEIIEERLQSADAVVVLWSSDAARSQWVRAEADFARNEGKLVQAQLDDTLPPLPFNQIQCADLRGWRGNRNHKGWLKLRDSIESIASGERPKAAEPRQAPPAGIDRRMLLAGLVVLLLLAGALAWMVPRLTGGGDDTPRVAVLPFQSVGASDDALAAGMWEDTRQALARNPQLLVLGPNSSQELAAKDSGAARKAADYLVEAKVRRAGDRVRISASLVRSSDETQVWSQNFDRNLDDVFALQSEIAQEIEGRIRGRLARGGGRLPENITTSGEVYALYSDARAKIRDRQVDLYEEALEQLERVVAMDPNFAPGWATLSIARTLTGNLQANSGDKQQVESRGSTLSHGSHDPEASARRAIALAPNLATGHAALGFALGRGPAAQSALRRAIALDPNDIEAMNWLAFTLDSASERSEKLDLYTRIARIEPFWWPAILNKLNLFLEARDFTAAEQERKRLQELGSALMAGMAGIAIENSKGNLSEAARIGIDTFNSVTPSERAVLGYELAFLFLKLGYFDLVMANFQIPPAAPYLWRNDPRGLDLIERLGLTPAQFFAQGPVSHSASRVYVMSGRGGRLAELYRSAARSPQEFETLVGPQTMAALAPVIAIALRGEGDEDGADRLLAVAESSLQSGRAAPEPLRSALLARVHSVQGRREDALRRLRAAVKAGWLPDPPVIMADLIRDAPLSLLARDPGFEAERKRILDYIAKERAELGPVQLAGARTAAPSR